MTLIKRREVIDRPAQCKLTKHFLPAGGAVLAGGNGIVEDL
jgi:hypothetical protein